MSIFMQEFAGSNAESEDDEMTLQEQEEHEDSDHAAELDELKEEGAKLCF